MIPVKFDEANCNFGPPSDLEESQCHTIPAYKGTVQQGSVEGSHIVVVAWKPSEQELRELVNGSPIFLSMIGGLAPHFLTTKFVRAISPT